MIKRGNMNKDPNLPTPSLERIQRGKKENEKQKKRSFWAKLKTIMANYRMNNTWLGFSCMRGIESALIACIN